MLSKNKNRFAANTLVLWCGKLNLDLFHFCCASVVSVHFFFFVHFCANHVHYQTNFWLFLLWLIVVVTFSCIQFPFVASIYASKHSLLLHGRLASKLCWWLKSWKEDFRINFCAENKTESNFGFRLTEQKPSWNENEEILIFIPIYLPWIQKIVQKKRQLNSLCNSFAFSTAGALARKVLMDWQCYLHSAAAYFIIRRPTLSANCLRLNIY